MKAEYPQSRTLQGAEEKRRTLIFQFECQTYFSPFFTSTARHSFMHVHRKFFSRTHSLIGPRNRAFSFLLVECDSDQESEALTIDIDDEG